MTNYSVSLSEPTPPPSYSTCSLAKKNKNGKELDLTLWVKWNKSNLNSQSKFVWRNYNAVLFFAELQWNTKERLSQVESFCRARTSAVVCCFLIMLLLAVKLTSANCFGPSDGGGLRWGSCSRIKLEGLKLKKPSGPFCLPHCFYSSTAQTGGRCHLGHISNSCAEHFPHSLCSCKQHGGVGSQKEACKSGWFSVVQPTTPRESCFPSAACAVLQGCDAAGSAPYM